DSGGRGGRSRRVLDAAPEADVFAGAAMTPLARAWRTALRYRARAFLAVVGVAVIGALNFDMLMLSRGLILSFADLLNGTRYNIRSACSACLPLARVPIEDAARLMQQVARLPEIASVAVMRTAFASLV